MSYGPRRGRLIAREYFLWAAICLLSTDVGAQESCGDPWKVIDGTCFLLSTTNKNFAEARNYCFKKGGVLASVRDSAEYSLIVKAVQLLGSSYQRVRWYVGLHQFDPADNTRFRWIDGSVSRFRHWIGSQPNNVHERCVQLDGSVGFKWRDELCHQRSRFICRKDPGAMVCYKGPTGTPYSWSAGSSMSATLCLEHCRGKGMRFAAPRRDTCYCFKHDGLQNEEQVDLQKCAAGSCGGYQHCGYRDYILVYNLALYQDLARDCDDLDSVGVSVPGTYLLNPPGKLEPVFTNCFGKMSRWFTLEVSRGLLFHGGVG